MATWQAREGVNKVWQEALFDKAHRLVRLHEGIKALEGQTQEFAIVRLGMLPEQEAEVVVVPVPRTRLLELLRALEGDVMQDMARILRQVTER